MGLSKENTGFDKPMKFNQPSSVSERLAADLFIGKEVVGMVSSKFGSSLR